MTAHIHDSAIRQEALDPHYSFIVQAPAGSGKTELLTQRYLVLLSHAEKTPEEIIAITFTRKAAAEMRARILHALLFAREPEPEQNDYRHQTWTLAQAVLKKDATLQWALEKNPNRLRILTIDALATFLCRQTPLLTAFGGSPKIADNATALYELAAQRFLMTHHPDLDSFLLHLDNNIHQAEKLLIELLQYRDQWLPHIFYAYQHQTTLRESLEKNLKTIVLEKMQSAAQAIPQHIKQTLLLLAHHIGDFFIENEPDHALSHCANWTISLTPAIEDIFAWKAIANLLLTKEGTWRKSITIAQGLSPKDPKKAEMMQLLSELVDAHHFKKVLQDIKLLPPTSYTETQWQLLRVLTTMLPVLAAQLTLVFQEKSEIDFTELNLRALSALGTEEAPTDLALYLDYQIRHLLIDEFQDTSVVHLHLLEKLTRDWQTGDGRTVFVVGDPMQSIYRFRNAEVGLFLRAQKNGIGCIQLHPLVLTMNFRSQGNIVDWFNTTFRAVFPSDADIATGSVPYTEAIAAKESHANSAAEFYPIFTEEDDIESAAIVEKIKTIHKEYPNDSIAILVRSRTQLISLIPILHQNQLPFMAVDIEPLSNRSEIQDLLSLTSALLHRADRIAWYAILRSPLCGLTLADLETIAIYAEKITIWEAVIAFNTIDSLTRDGKKRLAFFSQQIKIAYENQYTLSISQWIEKTWIALNGPACLKAEEELDYARAFFDLIDHIENHESFTLTALTTQCKKLFANNANNAKKTNCIQIMTIHKSKGLEFDHVFIPGLHRQTPSDSQKLLRWYDRPNVLGGDDLILAPIKYAGDAADPIYDYLKLIENEKQDHEITRLLYVAATRAKKKLFLFAQITWNEEKCEVNAPKKGSFLAKLLPVYETTISDLKPTTPPQHYSLASQHKKEEKTALLSRLPLSFFESNTDFETIEKTEKDVVYFDIQPTVNYASLIGTVAHGVFQTMMQYQHAPAKWHTQLLKLGLPHNECGMGVTLIEKAVQHFLQSQRGQWILSDHHQDRQTEYPLTYYENDTIHHVVIDLTFIDENNVRWIIDYKTTVPQESESLDHFLERQKKEYRDQLQRYANVLSQIENRSIRLGLYFPVCDAWLEWEYAA